MHPLNIKGVDPRHALQVEIKPPHPLPYVSRRALKRVLHRLDPPDRCNLCDNPVRLARNREIYNGQDYGDWPFVYLCRGCSAYVGLHPGTDLPLGTLADRATRDARKEAKDFFYMLVRKRLGSSSQAYKWLANRMCIEVERCHFAMFSQKEAEIASYFLRVALYELPEPLQTN